MLTPNRTQSALFCFLTVVEHSRDSRPAALDLVKEDKHGFVDFGDLPGRRMAVDGRLADVSMYYLQLLYGGACCRRVGDLLGDSFVQQTTTVVQQ